MTDEPIPDEFGSWARLLPTPEEKPAAEKVVEAPTPAAQAAEERLVVENATDETATLAAVSEGMFADDEPLFAQGIGPEIAHETVAAADAAHEILAEHKPPIQSVTAEARATEKPAAESTAEEMAPVEAVANKTELNAAAEPAIVEKAAEHKPAGEKVAAHPAADEKIKRPFRVKLRGSLLVLVRLPNKRTIQGSFHQLSTSGGVIHFEKPLDEKLEVELIFHLKTTTIRSKGQMLFPMWATQGWMQPFRFVGLAEDNRRVLDEGLKSFVGDLAKSTSAGA